MSLTIVDPTVSLNVSSASSQVEQLESLLAPWHTLPVTVEIFNGSTLLASGTYGQFLINDTTPRTATMGSRLSRQFTIVGTPTKVVFKAGTTAIFELTSGVSSGDVSFTASITAAAAERLQSLVVSAKSSLPLIPSFTEEPNTPYSVTVQDWSTGSAVDVSPSIVMRTEIRADKFEDPILATDCRGWFEHGPVSNATLPALDGVQFGAKLITIRSGGIYSQQSYRVLIAMRALGMVDGLYGNVKGVNHFPRAHKIVIKNQAGTVLKTIEMRDGLPVNDPSLINVPYEWTVPARTGNDFEFQACNVAYTPRLASNKAMRPHMSAGSAYVAFFGDEPQSSTSVRNKIPRAVSSLWNGRATKVRSILNGDDVHLYDPNYGGNGNAHPEVIPRWALSVNQIDAISSVVQNDTELAGTPNGYNWVNALRLGWDYEPGALGGITRRGGPGGVRVDRSTLPSEFYQMALMQSVRVNDNASTADMARGYALNHANYPGYYPKSMHTLDAVNRYSSAPQPTVPGNAGFPVYHYYGEQGNFRDEPGAVWISDTYGGNAGQIASTIEWANPGTGSARSTASHPRNGWCPDSEHNNRVGLAWAVMLYSDPLFTRMAELQMMTEVNIFMTSLSTNNLAAMGGSDALMIENCTNIASSRSAILPFNSAAMMWQVASKNGIYTREEIETKIHTFLSTWKTRIRDNIPAIENAVNATQKAYNLTGGLPVSWQTWGATNNYAAGSGWVCSFGLYSLYLGHLFMMMKSSGLYDKLVLNPTTALVFADLEKQLEFNARMAVSAPWAMTDAGNTAIILRTQAQGASSSDLNTIPTTVAQCISYNPPHRGDQYWFLNAAATPGVSYPSFVGTNYTSNSRYQTAHAWWKYFAPLGTERTSAISTLESNMTLLKNYTPFLYDAGFLRYNSIQTIPSIER